MHFLERFMWGNTDMTKYEEEQLELRKMQIKYSDMYYTLPDTYKEKNEAYSKAFHTGINFNVGYDTFIYRTHGLAGTIKIGNNVVISNHCTIDYSGSVEIGNNVHIAEGTKIYSHRHPSFDIQKKETSEFESIPEKTIIGNNVIIEAGAIICPGVIIGDCARVFAGSVVIDDIEPYGVVIGNPAEDIRSFIREKNKRNKK